MPKKNEFSANRLFGADFGAKVFHCKTTILKNGKKRRSPGAFLKAGLLLT